jgi:glycosyltransferase involved in cell wall biosynthesis
MKISKLIFFQNIISVHQRDVLNELCRFYSVFLFVEKEIDAYREGEKWDIPKSELFSIDIIKNITHAKYIISQIDKSSSVLIFSGIGRYKLIHKCFKDAISRSYHVGIMSETLNPDGIKGRIRSIKTYMFSIKYGRRIDFILAIGGNGYDWFRKHRFSDNKVFLWGYFVNRIIDNPIIQRVDKSRVLFVGRLVEQKGLLQLIQVAKVCFDYYDELCIIGKGPFKVELEKYISNNPKLKSKIVFTEYLPNKQIIKKISEYNLLVLPSIWKEGWGVVVNEALMVGTPVIASKVAGASILLDGSNRGETFDSRNRENFEQIFRKWVKKSLHCDRNEIIKWSDRLSPARNANYLKDILSYKYDNESIKPSPPWQAQI